MYVFSLHAIKNMNIKYKESLNNITLSDEARERIHTTLLNASNNTDSNIYLHNYNTDDTYTFSFNTNDKGKFSKLPKFVAIAASFAVITVASFAIINTLSNSSVGNNTTDNNLLVNNNQTSDKDNKNTSDKSTSTISFSDVVISEDLKNNPYYIGMLSFHYYYNQLDIPVAQYTDNDYFLLHDIFGNETLSGSAFIDYRCDANNPYLIDIYAHNMKDKTMFGSLSLYKNKEYFDRHNLIMYNNDYYQICAAYYLKSDSTGSFSSECLSIDTEDDFNKFITQVKATSLFDIDTMPKYGDKMINLRVTDYEHSKDNHNFSLLAIKCDDID